MRIPLGHFVCNINPRITCLSVICIVFHLSVWDINHLSWSENIIPVCVCVFQDLVVHSVLCVHCVSSRSILVKWRKRKREEKKGSSHNSSASDHCSWVWFLNCSSYLENRGDSQIKWLQEIKYLPGVVWPHCSLQRLMEGKLCGGKGRKMFKWNLFFFFNWTSHVKRLRLEIKDGGRFLPAVYSVLNVRVTMHLLRRCILKAHYTSMQHQHARNKLNYRYSNYGYIIMTISTVPTNKGMHQITGLMS